jgi:hypothetical protein
MEPTAAALNRKAWGMFLLAAALAAAWIGLNLLAPDLTVSRVPLRLLFMLATDVIVLYGLWRALARTEYSATTRVAAWVAVALGLATWIGAIWILAVNGIFQQNIVGNVPALPFAIFLPMLIGGFLLLRSRSVAVLLDATPPSWLVGVQVYRILGGIFLVYWIRGMTPSSFAVPAGIGDVATGLLALPAAIWVASDLPMGKKIGIRWNIFGLTDFVVAVTMGNLTSPGPAHLLALDHPNTLIGTFPTVMIPAFAVPFSTLLHLLSLRQLKRANHMQQQAATSARAEGILAVG